MSVFQTETMPVTFCCPIHHAPLTQGEVGQLVCSQCPEPFPMLDDIPVLLPDSTERQRVATGAYDDGKIVGNEPLDFYNQTRDHEKYFRAQLDTVREDLSGWLAEAKVAGPILEIGSGKGALQGIGPDYVALDYSCTALRTYVRAEYGRVCGSAATLPFADNTFRFLFTVATLEHVPEAGRAFDEVHRVLKPGGVAYLLPAWHCVQYNCEGIPVRPYRDLTWRQKIIKMSLPLRQTLVAKALAALPARIVRRFGWCLRQNPSCFRFQRLTPDYAHYWMSDTDATARLDSHEACLYFHSRGYEVLAPGSSAVRQLLARFGPVIVRKPRDLAEPWKVNSAI